MAIPCNANDFSRFLKLAVALSQVQKPAELSIYCSDDSKEGKAWVSLEIKGYLPIPETYEIFGIGETVEAQPDIATDPNDPSLKLFEAA